MAVLAPGWFSMTTGEDQSSLMRWAMTRQRMSVGPAGGNGTTMWMGRWGKPSAPSCAAALPASSIDDAISASRRACMGNLGARFSLISPRGRTVRATQSSLRRLRKPVCAAHADTSRRTVLLTLHSASRRPRSIKPQVKLRDHPRPATRLVMDEGRELLRRAAHGIVAGALGFFSQRGIGENARDLGVELGDDRRRGAARGGGGGVGVGAAGGGGAAGGDEAEPHRVVRKIRQPRRLAERRDIGHGGGCR